MCLYSQRDVSSSSCTFHISPRRDWFTTYESINSDSLLIGNDIACYIVGIGLVKIKMYDGIVKTLSNIRNIISLNKSFISLGILDSFGYQYSVTGGVIRVYKGSSVVMIGKKIEGLYFLLGETMIGGAASLDIPNSGIIGLQHM
ncbi:hypothetical protein I3843_11G064100 [Carya illinoinensis]|uniref:Retrovirus-related Pol polyprotein from transposon TNT 1-94-like beta-barrel domain-containing protein n=1 Tax=Carya illinoinensis TaxID=32201 RepID=A0A922IY56_CARIL|nr:hypothetical protein I3842_11G064000 [Carya illinoinensis]KAG7955292.1 hypothetical protein I3843_11G064100 [Carya illinoinensis]